MKQSPPLSKFIPENISKGYVMISIEVLEKMYEYFIAKKYERVGNGFIRTKTTRSLCEKFIEIVNMDFPSAGKDFVWDYFLYQFNHWEDYEFGGDKYFKKIVLSNIIGTKAYYRWKDRNKEYDWQAAKYPIIDRYKLNKAELFKSSLVFMNHEQSKKSERKTAKRGFDSSAIIREEFVNTERGFAVCVEFTTLYDPKDKSCEICASKSDCKDILKANYPLLFSIRMKNKE